MRYIVDRITDGKAVLEDEELGHIVKDVSSLPEGITEGSVLFEKNGEFFSDRPEELMRRHKLLAMQNRIKAKNKSGSTK